MKKFLKTLFAVAALLATTQAAQASNITFSDDTPKEVQAVARFLVDRCMTSGAEPVSASVQKADYIGTKTWVTLINAKFESSTYCSPAAITLSNGKVFWGYGITAVAATREFPRDGIEILLDLYHL